MALQKEITEKNGITAQYHKITSVNLFIRNKLETEVGEDGQTSIVSKYIPILMVSINGYVSKEYREANVDNSVMSNQYQFEVEEQEADSNLRALGYQKIKDTIPAFEGATDC